MFMHKISTRMGCVNGKNPFFTAWATQSQAKHDEQQLAFFNVLSWTYCNIIVLYVQSVLCF